MIIKVAAVAVAASLLASCASQSLVASNPVWVSTKINGLQGSVCKCGGVETKKQRERKQREQIRSNAQGKVD